MSHKVFIIGATTNRPKLNLYTFNKVEQFLNKQGYSTVKQHDLFDDWDHNILTQKEAQQRINDHIDSADVVVAIPGWMACSYARAQMQHARQMEKTVVRYEQWCKCLSTRKHNGTEPFFSAA